MLITLPNLLTDYKGYLVHYVNNLKKMELLQSQAPAEREYLTLLLLGVSDNSELLGACHMALVESSELFSNIMDRVPSDISLDTKMKVRYVQNH